MNSDVIIVRHSMSGAPEILAKALKSSVINAGDGFHEHPTQALLDLFTIKERLGKVEGLKIAIIGDIAHSRVARSNILCLNKMGAEVRVCGPATLMPAGIEKMGAKVYFRPEDAIDGADAVMMLRIQMERQERGLFPGVREYSRFFGLNRGACRACEGRGSDNAPRTYKPGGGDIAGGGGRAIFGHSGPGDERRGRKDGRNLPPDRG